MDFHVPDPNSPRFGVSWNGQNARGNARGNPQIRNGPVDSETLRLLSREERECLKFLEETIDSLDPDLDAKQLSRGNNMPAGHSTTPSTMVSGHSLNPKEQDIIDLVQTQPREASYSPPVPDFRSMVTNPQTHIEMRPRRDPLENFSHDFKLPHTVTTSATNESHNFDHSINYSLHHPAGSIPTPVVIAQKLAEHQKARAVSLPTTILSSQKRSLESDRGPLSPDHLIKQGPPTAAKPTHLPANISLLIGNKEYHQAGPKPPVNLQERKAQVLTHFTGSLEMDESTRNHPTQSASFRHSTPDRSRIEALSKLGLNTDHSSHSSKSRAINPSGPIANKLDVHSHSVHYTDGPELVHQSALSAIKKDSPSADFNSYGGKTKAVIPPTRSSSAREPHVNNFDKKTDMVLNVPGRNEVSSIDFNSFGGKSKIMNPVSSINSAAHHPGNYTTQPTKSGITSNSYGGKSKVMNPSIISKAKPATSPSSTVSHNSWQVTRPEAILNDNSYDGKSKALAPSAISSNKPEASARNPNQNNPVPAPRMLHASPDPSLGVLVNRSELLLPESSGLSHRRSQGSTAFSAPPQGEQRLSFSKPKASLPPQGITVQFSGRGPMDESRREALRKLGLLKET